jgi:hypothetical protein
VALEGDLKVFHLPDILQLVAQQQKTGILTVQGQQDIVAVSFLKGAIVAADALNQNFEDALGEVLASQGLLRPEQFAKLSDEQRQSGKRMAEFLVERQVLSHPQLLSALRHQTYRLLLQILRWRDGEFKFYSGDEVAYEEGMVPIPVEELLLRAVGDLLGEGTLSGALPHGFVAYEALESEGSVRVLGKDGEAREGSAVWLTGDEKEVYDRLDGKITAAELAQASGLGEYRTLYALFRLLQSGLARPSSASRAGIAAADEPEVEEAPPPKPVAKAPAPIRIELPAAPRQSSTETWLTWAVPALAIVFIALAVALAALRPELLLAPFPWQATERRGLEKQQRIATYQKLDRAARTYFLLEGHYPDSLAELEKRWLISSRDLADEQGRPFDYHAESATYTVQPTEDGVPRQELGVTESIAGDFFLDPEVYTGLEEGQGNPLVLLD